MGAIECLGHGPFLFLPFLSRINFHVEKQQGALETRVHCPVNLRQNKTPAANDIWHIVNLYRNVATK